MHIKEIKPLYLFFTCLFVEEMMSGSFPWELTLWWRVQSFRCQLFFGKRKRQRMLLALSLWTYVPMQGHWVITHDDNVEEGKSCAYSKGFLRLSGSISPVVLPIAFPARFICRCNSKSPAAQQNSGAGKGWGKCTESWVLLYCLQQSILSEEQRGMFLANWLFLWSHFCCRNTAMKPDMVASTACKDFWLFLCMERCSPGSQELAHLC